MFPPSDKRLQGKLLAFFAQQTLNGKNVDTIVNQSFEVRT